MEECYGEGNMLSSGDSGLFGGTGESRTTPETQADGFGSRQIEGLCAQETKSPGLNGLAEERGVEARPAR